MSANTAEHLSSTPTGAAPTNWEERIADLLAELAQVQSDVLTVLGIKSEAIGKGDLESLAECTAREEKLLSRLEECHSHREQLLETARQEGRPASSVEELALSLEGPRRGELRQGVTDARRRMRLLQHQCLTNWVVTQRTLIHLSQMIEIVATGGRMSATYGRPESVGTSGFVDQQA